MEEENEQEPQLGAKYKSCCAETLAKPVSQELSLDLN